MKVPHSFYMNPDPVSVGMKLLGKYLFTFKDGVLTGGFIVETEAYNGPADKASHAWNGRRTGRTEAMFKEGGIAHIYLNYGIHEMMNIVISHENDPRAVLIRAIEPTVGIDTMLLRKGMKELKPNVTAGPGSLTRALAITRDLNGISLEGDVLWLEDKGLNFTESQITTSPRIGVAYAGEDASLPYRFYVKGNKYVSKPNK
jgi:DNA-3-methyladenine glycosylase